MEPLFVRGDVFATSAQAIGIGLSANGRLDVTPFTTTLHDRFPVFISEYRRRARSGMLRPGSVWFWRESEPWLAALILRETPHGPARLRYLEAALLYLYHNWQREGLRNLALAHITDEADWPAAREILVLYARLLPGQLTVYETGVSGLSGS